MRVWKKQTAAWLLKIGIIDDSICWRKFHIRNQSIGCHIKMELFSAFFLAFIPFTCTILHCCCCVGSLAVQICDSSNYDDSSGIMTYSRMACYYFLVLFLSCLVCCCCHISLGMQFFLHNTRHELQYSIQDEHIWLFILIHKFSFGFLGVFVAIVVVVAFCVEYFFHSTL